MRTSEIRLLTSMSISKGPALSLTLSLTLGLLLVSGLLSGCATHEQTGSASKNSTETASTAAEESATLNADAATDRSAAIEQVAQDIPERPLDEATMARLLEAEFALYRKNIEAALGIYEQLAQQTADPGIAKRSAEVALATSDHFRTLDAALLYLELAPDDDFAIELAVRALARSAEVEGAWALLDEQVSADTSEQNEKTDALRMMTAEAIRLAARMQDNYQVEWLLQQILGKYGKAPKDKEVQLALAMIYESTGNFDGAAFYSAQANNQNPNDLLALRLRANALLRAGRREEASVLLSNWIKTNTEDAEAQISLAQLLLSFDRAAALPILEMLSARHPWEGQLLMNTAQLHLASDNKKAAIPYYQKLTQFGAFRNLSLFNLGRIYEQAGELELASEHYAAVGVAENGAGNTTARPTDEGNMIFEAGLRQARIEYQTGENGAVLFEELRQLYPEQRLGLIHEESGLLLSDKKLQPAIEILSMGIEDHPDSEPLLYTRSIAYERLGNLDGAIQDLTTILSFDDTNSVALNALGYILANRTDRYEEAYDLIDRALSIDPEEPAIIDSMGWVLYQLGRYAEALEYLEKAHMSMLDEEVISHLAQVLWKLHRDEEAAQLLDQGAIDLPDSRLIPETRTKLGLES